jgi:hypothetical protein
VERPFGAKLTERREWVQVEHTRPALAVPSTEAQCMDAFHAVGVYCNSTPVSGIVCGPSFPCLR